MRAPRVLPAGRPWAADDARGALRAAPHAVAPRAPPGPGVPSRSLRVISSRSRRGAGPWMRRGRSWEAPGAPIAPEGLAGGSPSRATVQRPSPTAPEASADGPTSYLRIDWSAHASSSRKRYRELDRASSDDSASRIRTATIPRCGSTIRCWPCQPSPNPPTIAPRCAH